ncbi:hypothetical protein RvY_07513-2 [Ramazzottius varieornatus]|uniref:Uncharacterized protein n=1 Tax=Ramazzottius varieornatus TaxID=947166 RepID=A0A1D1V5J8_RAMVA|nr:hypothetical protein RvY_07513-2 [Ramazzottius varieornatus]
MIYGLASPASCFSYVFREDISILSFGDHSGKVQALRFKNLFYDGFWTGLGIGQPANNQVSWATLKKLDKSVQIEATKKVGFISQIKCIPDLNIILTCTTDPTYSLNFIPIQSDRPRLHISNPEGGFDCFEYHHEMHLIATGGKDRTLRIWQPDRLNRPVMQFHNHGGSVDKVYLVKDHEFQVAISVDALRTIRIFDLKEQSLHQEFNYPINGVERGWVGCFHHNRATEQIFYGGTEILMVHRRSPKHSHHHANHVVTHKQAVVAALYNDLFDCIVSGGQDSSIIVWNCVDGEKIIQFFNAHTMMDHGKNIALPIRKMTFDSSRRRLLTVGEFKSFGPLAWTPEPTLFSSSIAQCCFNSVQR